jgi:hypothetical protein
MAIRSSEAEEKKAETCKMACYADNDNEDADDVNENADEDEDKVSAQMLSPAEVFAEEEKQRKEEAEKQKKINQQLFLTHMSKYN